MFTDEVQELSADVCVTEYIYTGNLNIYIYLYRYIHICIPVFIMLQH